MGIFNMKKGYQSAVFRWMPWATFVVYLLFCFLTWPKLFAVLQILEKEIPALLDLGESRRIPVFSVFGFLVVLLRAVEFCVAWCLFGRAGNNSFAYGDSRKALAHVFRKVILPLAWGVGLSAVIILDPASSFEPLRSLRHFIIFVALVYVAVSSITQVVSYLPLIFMASKERSSR